MRFSNLFICFLLCISVNCIGASYRYQTLKQVALNSDALIEANVKEIYTGWSPQDNNHATWVTFEVVNMISGITQDKELTLRFCGGAFKGSIVECTDTPDFDVDERVFMYVRYNEVNELELTSPQEGLFYFDEKTRKISNMVGTEAVQIRSDAISYVHPGSAPSRIASSTFNENANELEIQVVNESGEVLYTEHPRSTRPAYNAGDKPWNPMNFARQLGKFNTRNSYIQGHKNFQTRNVVRRYPHLKHMQSYKDLQTELCTGTKAEQLIKITRFFEMLGLQQSEIIDNIIYETDNHPSNTRSLSVNNCASAQLEPLFQVLRDKQKSWINEEDLVN